MFFFLGRQPGELGVQRVGAQEKGFLAVKDGRVRALAIVVALDLPGPQVELDASDQRRVRIVLEFRVGQVGKLARPAMDLDEVGDFDLAQVSPAAALDARRKETTRLATALSPRIYSLQRDTHGGTAMTQETSERAATSSAPEDLFADLFTEVFGLEKTLLLVPQYPARDIYDGSRFVDYALRTQHEKVAFEIDGLTWHVPDATLIAKYEDDLLKQNSLVHQSWRVFRWTDRQIAPGAGAGEGATRALPGATAGASGLR